MGTFKFPLFSAVEIFEIMNSIFFWSKREPVSICNMIDYDVFAKFKTKDREFEIKKYFW
jgi:hypothetical protein